MKFKKQENNNISMCDKCTRIEMLIKANAFQRKELYDRIEMLTEQVVLLQKELSKYTDKQAL